MIEARIKEFKELKKFLELNAKKNRKNNRRSYAYARITARLKELEILQGFVHNRINQSNSMRYVIDDFMQVGGIHELKNLCLCKECKK